MTDNTIGPALTAEEWEITQATLRGESPDYRPGSWTTVNAFLAAVGFRRDGLDHALAALCLDGQPFGFTREMLDRVREAAWDDESGVLHEVADRIQALLPVYDVGGALLPPEGA